MQNELFAACLLHQRSLARKGWARLSLQTESHVTQDRGRSQHLKMQHLVDFSFDDGGVDMFAPLPSLLNSNPGCPGEDDVLKFFHDSVPVDEAPTSSSSDGSGSSARDSTTPGTSQVVQSASGASWLQLAPQLAVQNAASAPVMYSMGQPQPQPQQQYHIQPAVWHSAFSSAEGTVQQSSKGK